MTRRKSVESMRKTGWKVAKWSFDHVGNAVLQPPHRSCFGQVPNRALGAGRSVALTFDDGPSAPSTGSMLDALGEAGVTGTFFCVGEMVTWHPDVVDRAHREGHVIANHSMYHSRRQSLTWSGVDHIEAAQDAIEQTIGLRPALYRPPWGWTTPWELRRARRLGLTIVGWDVYPDDWRDPEQSAEDTAKQVVERSRPGSIVLLHDATSGLETCSKVESARALPLVVDRLRDEGYEFVDLAYLLGVQPYLSPGSTRP